MLARVLLDCETLADVPRADQDVDADLLDEPPRLGQSGLARLVAAAEEEPDRLPCDRRVL